MTTAPALIALVAPAMMSPYCLALTRGQRKTIRPARLFQGQNFTFLLGSARGLKNWAATAGLGN